MAWKLCEHGTRGRCKPCGRGYCKHSKVKQMCRECDGRDFCEHDKRQSSCKECKGKSICKHDKRIQNCIKCCPDSFCVHKRLKNNCKICGGNNRCIHNIMKSVCVECGGGSLCVHGKKKQTCKECYPKKYKKWILVCSLIIKIAKKKLVNRSVLIDTNGKIKCYYDKIHMYDVILNKKEQYFESKTFTAGNKIKSY